MSTVNLMIIVPNNTDAPLHHHHHLPDPRALPVMHHWLYGSFCCRLVVVALGARGDLEQQEVEVRWMEQLRRGDGEGEASVGRDAAG